MSRWLPESVSTYGGDIDSIFYLIYYITVVSMVLVLGAMAWFLFKYRARPGHKAVYTHGNTTLEVIWTIVPALVFVALGLLSQRSWAMVKTQLPDTDIRVKVVGKQFNWEMHYPGLDGVLGNSDDVVIENLLNVPVGRPVRVVLASVDVIHSFFLPHVRLKQDALPGRDIEVWFEVTRTGTFEIPCAELCGFGHGNMLGTLQALEPGAFSEWARDRKAFPAGV